MMQQIAQQFDDNGDPLCIGCDKPVLDGQLYVEVRQRHSQDEDARLISHRRCVSTLVLP